MVGSVDTRAGNGSCTCSPVVRSLHGEMMYVNLDSYMLLGALYFLFSSFFFTDLLKIVLSFFSCILPKKNFF